MALTDPARECDGPYHGKGDSRRMHGKKKTIICCTSGFGEGMALLMLRDFGRCFWVEMWLSCLCVEDGNPKRFLLLLYVLKDLSYVGEFILWVEDEHENSVFVARLGLEGSELRVYLWGY